MFEIGGRVAASLPLSASACQSAIFGEFDRNYRNLAGRIIHISVIQFIPNFMKLSCFKNNLHSILSEVSVFLNVEERSSSPKYRGVPPAQPQHRRLNRLPGHRYPFLSGRLGIWQVKCTGLGICSRTWVGLT